MPHIWQRAATPDSSSGRHFMDAYVHGWRESTDGRRTANRVAVYSRKIACQSGSVISLSERSVDYFGAPRNAALKRMPPSRDVARILRVRTSALD